MRLGEVLRKWRLMSTLNTRDVARDIGVSAPTLNRVERGEAMDAVTLSKILVWLFKKGGQ